MHRQVNPPAKRFTFSIKSILQLTVAVAAWLAFRQAFPFSGLVLIWPIVVMPLLIYFRHNHLLTWLPLTTFLFAIALSVIAPPFSEYAAVWWVIFATCIATIAETTIRKTRNKIDNIDSFEELAASVFADSCKAGGYVGLNFGIVLTLIGLLVLPFSPTVGVIGLVYGLVGCVVITAAGAFLGLVLGFPLTMICEFIARRDICEQESDAADDTD